MNGRNRQDGGGRRRPDAARLPAPPERRERRSPFDERPPRERRSSFEERPPRERRLPFDEPPRRGRRSPFEEPPVPEMPFEEREEREPREPRQRRAFSTMGGPVETSGDPQIAQVLSGLFDVEPALARALTHGFHPYAGRMHPSIARGAVEAFSGPGQLVADPFCGSGTVVTEAMAAGRAAWGADASSLAVAIASTRTATLGSAGRQRLVDEAARIAAESGERARKRRPPARPAWARRELERFHPHIALELLGLRELVLATSDDEIGRALRMCFSSLLVKFMKAGHEAPRDGESKRIARGFPSRLFGDRAVELAGGLAALEGRTPAGTPAPRIATGDARQLALSAGSAVLVLSSPPYAGVYDYEYQHDVRFTWLDLPRASLRRAQLGARQSEGGTGAAAWRAGRRKFLAEMGRVLAPDGAIVLVVGDGVVEGRPEDAARVLAADAPACGLQLVACASQSRPPLEGRLARVFAGAPRREHIVMLRHSPAKRRGG